MGVPSNVPAMDRRTPNTGMTVDPRYANSYTRPAKPRVRVEADGSFTLLNVSPETFMSPMQPLPPFYQDPVYGARGRKFDYQVGINTMYTPRANTPVSFADLRGLAQNYDLLAMVIETRKDQMEALDWKIAYKDPDKKRDDGIDKLEALFVRPDRKRPYLTWMRSCLHEVFVTDALAIEPVFLGSGEFHSLKQIDGALIKPVIDEYGDIPDPPQPAYQQILKGIPVADFTSDELIYWPRNPRINHLYGFSPVEQIIVTVNIALRRQIFQLDYYRQGSIPDAMVGVPDSWTPEQLITVQQFWDAQFADPNAENLAERRKLKFMPGGGKVTFAKDAALKDEYDEWLARIVCYAFSVEPTPFVKQVNRNTAENQKEQSREEGLVPLKKYWKSLMDFVLVHVLKRPDVEFMWDEEEAVDRKTQSDIDVQEVREGIVTADEVRAERGLPNLPQETETDPRIPTLEQPASSAGSDSDNAAPGAGQEPAAEAKPGAAPGTTVHVHVGKAAASLMGKRVDATKRVPYGFGISEDGSTIYRDYRIPAEITVDGVVLPLDVTCGAHEVAEFQRVKKHGESYDPAHQFAQDESEHPLVRSFGVDPERYESTLLPFLAEALKVTDTPTPEDLARYPYEAEDALALLEEPTEKLAKSAGPRKWQYTAQQQRLTRAVKRQLRAQAAAVKDAVKAGTNPHKALDEAMLAFPSAVADPLKRLAGLGVRAGQAKLGKLHKDDSFGVDLADDFVDTYAADYASERGAEMVGKKWVKGELVDNPDARWQITDETRKGLQDLLEQQINQGWTLDEFTKAIDDAYAFSGNRADVIARTETRLADSKGQLSAWKESGVVARKVWLISNDGCCDDCQGNADQGEIDIDDDFDSGDDSAPAHPNCKCTVAPVVGEDEE